MNYDSRRWLFLAVSIVCNSCVGVVYAWSVFIKPLANTFNWQITDVSLSFTFLLGVGAFTGIVAGKAQEWIAPRWVVLAGGILLGCSLIGIGFTTSLNGLYFFSILSGVGANTIYPAGTISNMVKFFPDKPGFVAGLLTAGAGLGAVFIAPIAASLIQNWGVTTAFKILGTGFFILIVSTSWLIATAPAGCRPHSMIPGGETTAAKRLSAKGGEAAEFDKTWTEMLMSPLFYLIAGAFFATATSGMMLFGHVSPMAQDMIGMSVQTAAGVVMLLSIANSSGRMVWGYLSDRWGLFTIIFMILILLSLGMIGMTQVASYLPFVCMVMIIGLCYGGFIAILAPLMAELFGPKNLPLNFGIMFTMIAAGALVGPQMAAVLKAVYGSYTKAFVVSAGLNMLGIVLVALACIYRKRLAAALGPDNSRNGENNLTQYTDR